MQDYKRFVAECESTRVFEVTVVEHPRKRAICHVSPNLKSITETSPVVDNQHFERQRLQNQHKDTNVQRCPLTKETLNPYEVGTE